jgi:signal transduction histidine kinase
VGVLQGLVGAITEDDLLKELYQGFHILFDLDRIHFFLFDKEKEGLRGTAFPGHFGLPDISDVFIPLRFKESVLIQCLLSGMIKDVFLAEKGPGPIISDEQLVRFMGKQGMFCVPLLAHGDYVGTAVIGLDRPEADHLTESLQLLQIFMNQAALALHAHRLRQQQLATLQSERLMASSTMARRVVHEVNNPLGIIKNYLKILGMKLSEQGVAQDEIRIIDEEIDRVVTILRDLTEFSDSKVKHVEPVDVNRLIQDLLKLIKDAFSRNARVQIHTDLAPALPDVAADRNGLKQVLINLVKNSVEAMTGGGNLHLKTRLLSARFAGKQTDASDAAGGFVEITVADDGPGIPESMRTHAGIGLSIVHRIVKAMNGSIRCETEQGKGTAFKITLPTAGS